MPFVVGANGVDYISDLPSTTVQLGGVEEALFVYRDGDSMFPQLAEGWSLEEGETEDDFMKVVVTMKQGIRFNSPRGFETTDFGEFNAHEVVEWMNRCTPESLCDNPSPFNIFASPAVATDDYTLEVPIAFPWSGCAPLSQFGCHIGRDEGVHKVTTVDTHGEDWARAHHVGTGPFVQGHCVFRDTCTVHALAEHWRKVPDISEYTAIAVQDEDMLKAMLRSGQVDFGVFDYMDLPDLLDHGTLHFLETMPGGTIPQSIIWAGNLWEHSHALFPDTDLEPWKSPVYSRDFAWIGNPWGTLNIPCSELDQTGREKCGEAPYEDLDNPPGMDDMEQARLVRLALSIAIDRKGMNQRFLDGISLPVYSEYMGPTFPGWDPGRDTGSWDWLGNRIEPSGSKQPVNWELNDNDLEEAGRLLDLAGFPLVDGVREGFGTMSLQSHAAEAGRVGIEYADAIVERWSELGIEVVNVVEDYGAFIRPRLIDRTQFLPVLKNGNVPSNRFPLDFPIPHQDFSGNRPGLGFGFESQAAANWWLSMQGATRDEVKRIHLDWVDYAIYWQQYSGVFQVSKGVVATTRIESWDGTPMNWQNISRNPEFIVLRD